MPKKRVDLPPMPTRPDGSPMFPTGGGFWDCPEHAEGGKHYRREVLDYIEENKVYRNPVDFKEGTGRSATMVQVRCQTCGYWSCWVPKSEAGKYDKYGWLKPENGKEYPENHVSEDGSGSEADNKEQGQ